MPYLVSIHVDGSIVKKDITGIPPIEELKTVVGGWLETVPYFTKYNGEPCIAFCDEEGKLKHKPHNPHAQILWEKAYGRPITEDYLVGNIVIVVGPKSFLSKM